MPGPNVPLTFPEGTYRKEVTTEQLTDLRVNLSVARLHTGVWTITFRDGVFSEGAGCPGSTYATVDGRLEVTMGREGPWCGEAAGRVLFSSGWQLQGSSMTFTGVGTGHGSEVLTRALFGGTPWTRIG